VPSDEIILLRIRNWKRFQHYKGRNPPWIKLYNSLLDDYEFQALTELTQRHAFHLMLLASNTGNRIPFDPTWVAKRINARSKVDMVVLITCGFLEGYNNDAKIMLAERFHTATPIRLETDKIRDRLEPPIPPRGGMDGFEEFWKIYPKRVGKKAAEKSWKRITGVPKEKIIQAIKAQVEGDHFRGTDGGLYELNPATWLNQGRWEDEIRKPQEEPKPKSVQELIEERRKVRAREEAENAS